MAELRKPVFTDDIDYLGVWYWCEVEGYEKLARRASGNMMFIEKEVMGWDVKTQGDIWKRQKEVNYAPRFRLWKSEMEDDMPTPEERAAGAWSDEDRLWMPTSNYLFGGMKEENDARWEEFCRTGRTVWEDAQ